MPKLERKVDINASQDIIWKIIDDEDNYAKWNIVVNEAKKLSEGNYFFKTNVGDITSTRVETNPPNSLAGTQEGSPMTSLGYKLEPKGNVVEATIWAEFDDVAQEPILGIAGEMLLKSLQKYAEYLDSGGNPDNFSKK
ncbi:MAG: SRPBCC family protein [Candidatus Lokiarchaeia archaeon]|nr:SRPBCC family protein [Candidatus Lokiarchaeia archaeon]